MSWRNRTGIDGTHRLRGGARAGGRRRRPPAADDAAARRGRGPPGRRADRRLALQIRRSEDRADRPRRRDTSPSPSPTCRRRSASSPGCSATGPRTSTCSAAPRQALIGGGGAGRAGERRTRRGLPRLRLAAARRRLVPRALLARLHRLADRAGAEGLRLRVRRRDALREPPGTGGRWARTSTACATRRSNWCGGSAPRSPSGSAPPPRPARPRADGFEAVRREVRRRAKGPRRICRRGA